MAYFGGSLRTAGDPGFFGALKGAIGGFFEGGPIGAVRGGVRGLRGGRRTKKSTIRSISTLPPIQGFVPEISSPPRRAGVLPAIDRFFTGPDMPRGTLVAKADGTIVRRRRRMNPANPKALRRAVRRTDAFVNMAKGALKNTGFKIVSKSAGKMTEAAFQKRAHHRK